MNTTFRPIALTSRWVVTFFLLLASTAFVLAMLSSPAHADPGGDGGGGPSGGTGGDGCLLDGWDHVRDPMKIKLVDGADGDLCGNPADPIGGLRGEGATGCANHASDVVSVLYVTDASGSWATSNATGTDQALQTRNHLRGVINDAPDSYFKRANGIAYEDFKPDVIRDLLRKSISRDTFNTVVCAWIGEDTAYECAYLDGWGNYVSHLVGNTQFNGPGQASRNCFVRCPEDSISHAGEVIPIRYNNDRAAYCWPAEQRKWNEYSWGSALARDGFGSQFGVLTEGVVGGNAVGQPYAYTIEARDGGDPVPGQRAFTPQSENKLSSFGEFFNKYCTVLEGCATSTVDDSGTQFEQFKQDYEAAVIASRRDSHATLNLSEDNRQALSQGRVITMAERVHYAYVAAEKTRDRYYRRGCTETTSFNMRGQRASISVECDQWQYVPELQPDSVLVTTSMQRAAMPQLTRSYQVLTNRCNTVGFLDVPQFGGGNAPANGTGIVDSGDASAYYAAVAVSPVVTNVGDLPWGNIAGNASSRPEFFDRMCHLEGKLTATDANAANVLPRKDWTFFRDGEWKGVNIAYFSPVASDVVRYGGSQPIATYLTRDLDGTPDRSLMNFRGVCGTRASENAFGDDTNGPGTLRQFTAPQQYNGDAVSVLEGCYNSLQAKSAWASEAGRPQTIAARWRYSVPMTMRAPTQNLGFGGSGGTKTWTAATTTTSVDGMVTAVNNNRVSASDLATRTELSRRSGTGTTDFLSTPLAYGSDKNGQVWNVDPTLFDVRYFTVKFVRAIGS